MEAQMVFNKRGNKVIAVVVTGLDAQLQRMARRLASCLQQLRAQLRVEKLIRTALVNQQRQTLARVSN